MSHYKVLDVSQSATPDEIKRAYREKMKNHQNETDPDMFMQIRAVYEVLIDPSSRKLYDEGLALGNQRLNLLETLETNIETAPGDVQWRDVETLLPFANESERVAAVVLQALYFLDRTEEAIELAKRLERSNKLSTQLREYYAYSLRSASKYDDAIRQFKLIIFDQNEEVLDTLMSYGRLLMQAKQYHNSKERFEKWMMAYENRRMLVWKNWMECTIFFGRREDYELPLLWLNSRFTAEEQTQARDYLTGLCMRAEEYGRHDAIQIMLDECEDWIRLEGIDSEYLDAVRKLGGVHEEMDVAFQAKNIPLEFFYPMYTYIKKLKGTATADDDVETDFEYLAWWLNDEEINRAYVMKFKLLYPKTYDFLKREYDICFKSVEWR